MYIVKSTPLRDFSESFQHFAEMLQKMTAFCTWPFSDDVCIMTDRTCMYIVKSTPLRDFIGSFQHFAEMLQLFVPLDVGLMHFR